MKLAHIINPVKVTEDSDLFIAQPITFETMRNAKKSASCCGMDLEVELYFTCYEDDLDVSPHDFQLTKLLNRTIQDLGVFNKKRMLPLLKDILDSLYVKTDADYLIYTNVDIALMPHFYSTVARLIEKDYDAFVINRRTISDEYRDIEDIPLMYSEVGDAHPGFDCFIFKRSAYHSYVLNDICLGINWIGTVLLWNMQVFSNKFKVFSDAHLTFHIGNDKKWKSPDFEDYVLHNKNEARNVYLQLQKVDKKFKDDVHWKFLKV